MSFDIIATYGIGAVFMLFGIMSFAETKRNKRVCVKPAAAEVVDYEIRCERRNHHSSNVYYPIFSYYAGGRQIRKRGSSGYDGMKYPVGTPVDILYEPENPENFIVPSAKSFDSVSLICALIGIGLIVLAYLRTVGIVE